MRLLLCIALASLCSCSLFAPSHQAVTVSVNDASAAIFVDGQHVGTGSASVNLQRNTSHAFRAEAADGRSAVATVGTSISSTGALDIVGTFFFLFPIVGLAGPGFWSLDQTAIVLSLPPAS